MKMRVMTAALFVLLIAALVISPVAGQGWELEQQILKPSKPEPGYQWIDSGTELYTLTFAGVQYEPRIVVGAYVPEVFKTGKTRPVYIYVTRLSQDVSALDTRVRTLTPTGNAFGINFCGGISVEVGQPKGFSWYVHLSIGYTFGGKTHWDVWCKHIPISGSALAQSTEYFKRGSLNVIPEVIVYERIADIPYREWDEPFAIDTSVQLEPSVESESPFTLEPFEIPGRLEPFEISGIGIPGTLVEAETPFIKIQPGSPATIQLDNVVVKQLTVNTLEEGIPYTALRIRQLVGKPLNITAPPSHSVYRYFTISGDLEDSDVSSADIQFTVERAWIAESQVDESTIRLNRYDPAGEVWTSLPTEKTSEDDLYVYYSATSPGFSLFAITGEARMGAPVAVRLRLGLGIAAIIALLGYFLLVEKRSKMRVQRWNR